MAKANKGVAFLGAAVLALGLSAQQAVGNEAGNAKTLHGINYTLALMGEGGIRRGAANNECEQFTPSRSYFAPTPMKYFTIKDEEGLSKCIGDEKIARHSVALVEISMGINANDNEEAQKNTTGLAVKEHCSVRMGNGRFYLHVTLPSTLNPITECFDKVPEELSAARSALEKRVDVAYGGFADGKKTNMSFVIGNNPELAEHFFKKNTINYTLLDNLRHGLLQSPKYKSYSPGIYGSFMFLRFDPEIMGIGNVDLSEIGSLKCVAYATNSKLAAGTNGDFKLLADECLGKMNLETTAFYRDYSFFNGLFGEEKPRVSYTFQEIDTGERARMVGINLLPRGATYRVRKNPPDVQCHAWEDHGLSVGVNTPLYRPSLETFKGFVAECKKELLSSIVSYLSGDFGSINPDVNRAAHPGPKKVYFPNPLPNQ